MKAQYRWLLSGQLDLDLQEITKKTQKAAGGTIGLSITQQQFHIEIKASTDGPSPILNTKHACQNRVTWYTFDITLVPTVWLTNYSTGPFVLQKSAHGLNSLHCNRSLFDVRVRSRQITKAAWSSLQGIQIPWYRSPSAIANYVTNPALPWHRLAYIFKISYGLTVMSALSYNAFAHQIVLEDMHWAV